MIRTQNHIIEAPRIHPRRVAQFCVGLLFCVEEGGIKGWGGFIGEICYGDGGGGGGEDIRDCFY